MPDTIELGAAPSMNDGPDLRTLLGEHHSVGAAMRETTSAPHIDIPTTTAAVAAAQEAQLRNTVDSEEQHHNRADQGLAMSVVSVIERPSSPLSSLQDIQHQASPGTGNSPTREVSDHDMRMSPTAGEINPPATICLCQQPARIPRPRNAFILFRQHNHASVVAANPGRPNPEISKIIGEMWRESSKETKLIWQKHADEEKRQHLARYPEYKYQPRRNGKKGALASGAPGMIESAVCSTCGGHTGALNTPETPNTPMSATMTATPHSAVSKTFRNTYMPTPKTPSGSFAQIPPLPKSTRRRKQDQDPKAGVEALLQLGITEQEEGELSPAGSPAHMTHTSKKRRLTPAYPTSSVDAMDSLRTPHSSIPLIYGQDPNIDPFLKHTNLHEASFGASESPAGISGEAEHDTPLSPSSPPDEVLKAISPLSKLQAIAKICKPLPAPEVNPGAAPRGAIIAIDGEDAAAVNALCESLADTLKGEMVEIVNVNDEIDKSMEERNNDQNNDDEPRDDTVMHDYNGRGGEEAMGPSEEDAFEEEASKTARYLEALAAWRHRSTHIRRKVILNSATQAEPQSGTAQPINATTTTSSTTTITPEKLPIIIINRYILSRTDSATSKLNADGFTPIQHWQWVASLWKGCVGADMTILVKSDKGNGVEVKDPGKIIVARKEVGKEWDGGSVRRLGFEVGECVRTLMGVNS